MHGFSTGYLGLNAEPWAYPDIRDKLSTRSAGVESGSDHAGYCPPDGEWLDFIRLKDMDCLRTRPERHAQGAMFVPLIHWIDSDQAGKPRKYAWRFETPPDAVNQCPPSVFPLHSSLRPLPGPHELAQHMIDGVFLHLACPFQLGHQAALLAVYHLRHPCLQPGLPERGVVDPCYRALAQVRLEDLANRGLGQLVQDLDMTRNRRALMDMHLAVLAQFLARNAAALDKLHIGAGNLARMRVGLANGAGDSHGIVGHQCLLDVGRIDIVPAPDDQILGTSRDPEVSVLVDPAEISGAQVFAMIVQVMVLGRLGIGVAHIDPGVR